MAGINSFHWLADALIPLRVDWWISRVWSRRRGLRILRASRPHAAGATNQTGGGLPLGKDQAGGLPVASCHRRRSPRRRHGTAAPSKPLVGDEEVRRRTGGQHPIPRRMAEGLSAVATSFEPLRGSTTDDPRHCARSRTAFTGSPEPLKLGQLFLSFLSLNFGALASTASVLSLRTT